MTEIIKLNNQLKNIIYNTVISTIEYGIDYNTKPDITNYTNNNEYSSELRKKIACFVSIKIFNKLNGCMGSLIATKPLINDLVDNSYSAAFLDNRFPPIIKEHLKNINIEISFLNHPKEIFFDSEQDLISKITPKIDGLIIIEGKKKGTFLPSVWKDLPQKKVFLAHLKIKAGLNKDYWSNNIKIFKYQTQIISF